MVTLLRMPKARWVLMGALALMAAFAVATIPAYAAYAADGQGSLVAATTDALTKGGVVQPAAQPTTVTVYSLRHPKSGDRIYTTSKDERARHNRQGWVSGGSSWTAPAANGAPVYCLYRSGKGHVYTSSASERAKYLKQRWRDMGIAFYQPYSNQPRVALYRDYDPKSKLKSQSVTPSRSSHDARMKKGWKSKGLWYAVPSASQLRNGWVNQGGQWRFMSGGAVVRNRMLSTSKAAPINVKPGKQRYWLDSNGNLARNRLVDRTKAVDKKAGAFYFAKKNGTIVVGKYKYSDKRTYVADRKGKLPSKGGWLVTKKYDTHLQRYYIDKKTHAAKTGTFKVGKKRYQGIAGKGYVNRNNYVKYKNAWYKTSNSGAMKKDAKVTRMAKKAQRYGSDTRYLIMIDVDNPVFLLFKKASGGGWDIRNVWECDTGHPSTPTVTGVYKMGIKGYSFGHGYTCYYYSQILGDYLIHTRIYQEGTWIMNDGPLGRRCSQGCVRLATENAKWVWDHVPSGTTIVCTY